MGEDLMVFSLHLCSPSIVSHVILLLFCFAPFLWWSDLWRECARVFPPVAVLNMSEQLLSHGLVTGLTGTWKENIPVELQVLPFLLSLPLPVLDTEFLCLCMDWAHSFSETHSVAALLFASCFFLFACKQSQLLRCVVRLAKICTHSVSLPLLVELKGDRLSMLFTSGRSVIEYCHDNLISESQHPKGASSNEDPAMYQAGETHEGCGSPHTVNSSCLHGLSGFLTQVLLVLPLNCAPSLSEVLGSPLATLFHPL